MLCNYFLSPFSLPLCAHGGGQNIPGKNPISFHVTHILLIFHMEGSSQQISRCCCLFFPGMVMLAVKCVVFRIKSDVIWYDVASPVMKWQLNATIQLIFCRKRRSLIWMEKEEIAQKKLTIHGVIKINDIICSLTLHDVHATSRPTCSFWLTMNNILITKNSYLFQFPFLP